jgi:DNA-binding response OmpR family regulator
MINQFETGPIRRYHSREPNPQAPPPVAHILLIEDDDQLRKALSMSVVCMGHRVTEARNGREGLERHRTDAADLVVTDLIMPEMDGLEVIPALRRLKSEIRIIAISGAGRVDGKDYLQMAKMLGANQAIAKPFTFRSLVDAINGLLKMI